MNSSLKSRAIFFCMALAGGIAPASAAPWYVGEFRGAKPENPTEPQMSVICKLGERCAVLVTRNGGAPTPLQIPINELPKPMDPTIPNNNLENTRQIAASRPDLYKDSSFGPILTPLRPVLQSQARFAECVDLDGTEYFAMCSLSTDIEGTRSVILLLSTMNGSCGTLPLPFCAYYFVPVGRVFAK